MENSVLSTSQEHASEDFPLNRTPVTAKLDAGEKHFLIPSGRDGLRLFLRYLGPATQIAAPRPVLYIHGATFPSALSIAHRFNGWSWRDELNRAGFDVWGLDFLGFGGSDRYPEMGEGPERHPALGCAEEASLQIERAVRFISDYHAGQRVSIIAHSWGTMPTGLFAGRFPELVNRLIFFAPIAQRNNAESVRPFSSWRFVTLDEQWQRFIRDVPHGEPGVLSQKHFEDWGPLYLATDPECGTRTPASVKVPNGPTQEIAEAFSGRLAYDPQIIRAPVGIIRGAWDSLVTDADAAWLFGALKNSAMTRDVKIGRGTHLLHLEQNRYALYRESQTFLEGGDEPTRI